MSLTLLVENNPKIESFYRLNLTTWLGLETVSHKKAETAVKFLETDASNIKLIIVRSRIEKEQTARVLIEYSKMRNLTIPIIVIGPGQGFGTLPQVANSLDLKLLIKTAATALNITAKEMMSKVVPDYYPIPLEYFHVLKRPVCTVYLKDVSTGKYTLCLEKNKDFVPQVLKTLANESVTTLYVDKMDRLEFVNNVSSELISMLKSEDISEDEQVTATDKGIELLSKKLLTIGVTEETITLARKNIDAVKKNVTKHPQLAKLLGRLLSNKASYLYKHTQILTYVSLHIVRNIDWGTPEQEEKISFISFFHDIALENDVQCKINSTADLKKSELSSEARSLVERHAQMAAEFVLKFPHAPMGADQIVRQHHGQLNGVGFSEHYGANISPMAIVFIVAEEFTRIIMRNEEGPFDRNSMLRELKDTFPTSRFNKVLELLQTITF